MSESRFSARRWLLCFKTEQVSLRIANHNNTNQHFDKLSEPNNLENHPLYDSRISDIIKISIFFKHLKTNEWRPNDEWKIFSRLICAVPENSLGYPDRKPATARRWWKKKKIIIRFHRTRSVCRICRCTRIPIEWNYVGNFQNQCDHSSVIFE